MKEKDRTEELLLGGDMIKSIFKEQKIKIAAIAILLGIACVIDYYFLAVIKAEAIFTHLFYIQIILACFWTASYILSSPPHYQSLHL